MRLIKNFTLNGEEPSTFLWICLDTMNLLTMLEELIQAVRRILPWVVSTHIKDGGIFLNSKGLESFPCQIGKGIIDFKEILLLLSSLPQEINLSIEDHGGSFLIPVFDRKFTKGFPDLSLSEFMDIMCGFKNIIDIVAEFSLPLIRHKPLPQELFYQYRVLKHPW